MSAVQHPTCGCHAGSILIFPCSGSSNVGQIANAVGIELTELGRARMYCLAGMGGHIEGMVDSAAHADYRIALDGCSAACARKTLEHAGLTVDKAVIITDLGITKNHTFTWSFEQIGIVISAVTAGIPEAIEPQEAGCGCGCEGD